MNQPTPTNANDYKVVSFRNSEEFDFTPDMGCMYDGRSINGSGENPGIAKGETKTLPYHVGHRLAINLAKMAMIRRAPAVDTAGIPTGVPIWDEPKMTALATSYLTDLYSEEKPLAKTETDILMEKVEKYTSLVEKLLPKKEETIEPKEESETPTAPKKYQDKAEVIEELKKKGIKYDARQTKDALEKLLA